MSDEERFSGFVKSTTALTKKVKPILVTVDTKAATI